MPELTDDKNLRSAILAEARSRIPRPPEEDEMTANQLAREEGCTAAQARTILRDMVEEGRATVRANGIEGGKTCKVYKSMASKP